jgi:oligoribonuclease
MAQVENGASTRNSLIWIDLEMTGLVPESDRIIEIATIITDNELNILAEGPVLAVHQAESVLAAMDDWNQRTHKGTGLIERVRASTLSEAEAERQTLEFIQRFVPKNKSPMCGNSICQDRRFLARCMPTLEAWFHYRNLDVSTLKELAARWKPALANGLTKKGSHRALDDIRESIEELRYYREHFLVR